MATTWRNAPPSILGAERYKPKGAARKTNQVTFFTILGGVIALSMSWPAGNRMDLTEQVGEKSQDAQVSSNCWGEGDEITNGNSPGRKLPFLPKRLYGRR